MAIVDTPQMQRLRGLSQLGVADYVYMNAKHNRFEHSLGVGHLAEKLAERLRARQPMLNISNKDVVCVKIAGLCHDLGHGPFSHIYDGEFRKQVKEQALSSPPSALKASSSFSAAMSPPPASPKVPSQPPYPSFGPHTPTESSAQPPTKKSIVAVPPSSTSSSSVPPPPPLIGEDPYTFFTKNNKANSHWTHEDASLMMIDALLAHHGLAVNLSNLDAPLLQIGDGIDREKFGISARSSTTVSSYFDSDKDGDLNVPRENVITSRDIVFIKECILGGPIGGANEFVGRPAEKEFLYDIVSNRHSGLDVDKMDYYARDQIRALGNGAVDVMFIEEAFVAHGSCPNPSECFKCKEHLKRSSSSSSSISSPSETKSFDHLMICYPEKMVLMAMEFFQTRFNMHSNVYSHKTVKAVEFMVCDILLLADPHLRLTKRDGTSTRISQAMEDMGAYLKLKDGILEVIENSESAELQPARDLIFRLRSRDLYKCVYTVNVKEDESFFDKKTTKQIAEEICAYSKEVAKKQQTISTLTADDDEVETLEIRPEDVIIEKRIIHHGSLDKNPVSKMRFLSKDKLGLLGCDDVSRLPTALEKEESEYSAHIPRQFQERMLRVYSRDHSKGLLLINSFMEWQKRDGKNADSPVHDRGTICFSPTSSQLPKRKSKSACSQREGGVDLSQSSQFSQDSEEGSLSSDPKKARKLDLEC